MKLLRVRVTKYKSINDSGWVDIDAVTTLVGKNESGKTTFLQALYKLNPVTPADGNFDPIKEYPRREYVQYKTRHDTNPDTIIVAEYQLDQSDEPKWVAIFGDQFPRPEIVTASKNYKNQTSISIPINADLGVTQPKIDEFLKTLPEFFYFDDYSVLKGKIPIENLQQKTISKTLDESDRTCLSLLSLASAKLEDFQFNQHYEALKAKLEATSSSISDQVFKYWTQNKQLSVEFDIVPANPKDPAPFNQGTILYIRIRNDRHRVSVPFDERSRGFVWFFSFLAYFSDIERKGKEVILLLDEPGLNLHAKAQGDFLKLIDESLASKHQVIYTTHSPFMIYPGKLERVRTVQDVDDIGTVISKDVLKNDRDTIFPLQAALGYELAQTLFVGPHCLLVEGPSDLLYLQLLSQKASKVGKQGLAPQWVIVPCGGADKICTFVSLLGSHHLNIVVLMDVSQKDRQRVENLQANALLGQSNLIQMRDITRLKNSDIEDLFQPAFYLGLVNGAYGSKLPKKINLADLTDPDSRITKKIESYFKENCIDNGYFNHYLPAEFFLRQQNNLLDEVDESTLLKVVELFTRINALLTTC